jgi:hypothetical protein
METIEIKAFRATERPDLCDEFLRQHRKVLEDFGITNVTTNNAYWTTDPTTIVIVAISSSQGMVGGIRIECDKGRRELPIRTALYDMDHRIDTALDALREKGNAEVCGLWNSNAYSAKGIPTILAFAAVAVASQVGLTSLVCLVAHYTLRHATKSGFTIMEDVGHEGTFTYPIPSIKAIAMVIPNVITLETAPALHRKELLSLRLRPKQDRIEVINGVATMLKYDLCIDQKVIDLTGYLSIEVMRCRYAATA